MTSQTTSYHTVVHNYSKLYLTQSHKNILDKGLSFIPNYSFTLEDRLKFLTQFDSFSNSLRKSILFNNRNREPCSSSVTQDTTTPFLHRCMKFLKGNTQETMEPYLTVSNAVIENYIEKTKVEIDKQLEKQQKERLNKANISKKDLAAIKDLKRKNLVIKPADKNLGIAILNSEDYVRQCLLHLASTTYTRVETFPTGHLFKTIQNVLIRFKKDLGPHKKLYNFLQPNNSSLPTFYGLPKVHKPLNQKGIPPLKPIVSHSNSLLSSTARFLDHVLQPLAQSYPDFLSNSTELVNILENITVPEETIVVTLDVISLYPSIPQGEFLDIIPREMFEQQELIIFNPNLVTHLLHTNINNNYFQFAGVTFLQLQGTAMGAAFSPTIANIYMSVMLRNFLTTASKKPLLLKRYLDDIFIIWPKRQSLTRFIHNMNSSHLNIKYTLNQSETHINFLDLTIFKARLPCHAPARYSNLKPQYESHHKPHPQLVI